MCFNSNNINIYTLMVKKIINSYFELLDEKLENWTLVVLVIAILVILVSILINDLQMKQKSVIHKTTIEVNWKKYQLINE